MKTKQLSSKQLIALVLILIGAVSSIFGITGLTKSSSEDPYESRNGIVMVYATVYDNEGNSEAGMGTGWAIGTPGQPIQYIVTNGHVVNKAYTYPRYDSSLYGGEIDVFFSAAENDYVKAKVVYFSPQEEKDIAILQLPSPTDKRTALTLRDSGDIKIGDTAYALGYPGNSSQRQDFATYDIDDITITRGIISKRTTTSFSTYEAFQMDVSIAPGNSGGPLVDEKGNVIGINVAGAIDPNTGLSLGMNYAIIINELTKILDVERIPYTFSGSGFSLFHGPGSAVLLLLGILLIAAGTFFFWKERKAAASVTNSRSGLGDGLANGSASGLNGNPVHSGAAGSSSAHAIPVSYTHLLFATVSILIAAYSMLKEPGVQTETGGTMTHKMQAACEASASHNTKAVLGNDSSASAAPDISSDPDYPCLLYTSNRNRRRRLYRFYPHHR